MISASRAKVFFCAFMTLLLSECCIEVVSAFLLLRPSTRTLSLQTSAPLPTTIADSTHFHRLCATKSSDSIPSSTKVLFQKVVRPSKTLPDLLFLGYLVEYLESHFQLPNNLPMVYETTSPDPETRCILAWDSPLSPSPDATRMDVEVVGIYTDGNKKQVAGSTNVPNMAMVVVRKSKNSPVAVPPMMQGLFSDSERKILKALEKGLEDFVEGKVVMESTGTDNQPSNYKTLEEALEMELLSDDVMPTKSGKIDSRAEDVVFDTYAKPDDVDDADAEHDRKPATSTKSSDQAKADALASMRPQREERSELLGNKGILKEGGRTGDFAVEAAMKAAAARAKGASKNTKGMEKKASGGEEDFAVTAARKVVAAKQKAVKGVSKKAPANPVETPDVSNDPLPIDPAKFKLADYMGKDRAFRTTISRPKKRKKKADASKDPETKDSKDAGDHEETCKVEDLDPPSVSESPRATSVVEGSEPNLIKDPARLGSDRFNRESREGSNTPSKEQIEMDIMKAAQKVMSDMVVDGEDMTAEELLQDILKFDEKQQKESTPGSGFVSGAFEKAKELMKERNSQRQARMTQAELPTAPLPQINYDLDGVGRENNFREMTLEEELKAMFEAGERIADGRITHVEKEESNLAEVRQQSSEDEVDSLIAQDKSISSYAKVLDDELVELELAINRSPGEESDGPRNNPIFDVMSGPEVYNPNTELDAVNYPGAMPGTKEVRLPKELKESIEQASFASSVLQQLRVEKVDESNGTSSEKYFVGKKQFPKEKVEKLRSVVAHATEVGIIRDPMVLLQERSRLQMVLDELWDQPDERFREISENYKDLLLSENFVQLVKERMNNMADQIDELRGYDDEVGAKHSRERLLLGQLVTYAQLLVKEARALGAELEAQQLELVRSICKVAMDPSHQTEEETAMALSDVVRDMRPLLDDMFVAYLKYAVAEEEARLARAGLLDDPDHNQWLFVLKIVQQGVYAEIAKSINRYIDHISYVLRMNTPKQRRMLLSNLIDDMPTMDVRPFVQVVENIVGSLGDGARGDFDGIAELGDMTNKLLQLHKDMKELLPPERIAVKSRDADEWVSRQKEKLLEARKVGRQRLQAARETEHMQEKIDTMGRRGEIERMD